MFRKSQALLILKTLEWIKHIHSSFACEKEIRAIFPKNVSFQKQLIKNGEIQRNSLIYVHKKTRMGFPGGAVVKNPPANAGDMGASPGLGKIPHVMEQLSP